MPFRTATKAQSIASSQQKMEILGTKVIKAENSKRRIEWIEKVHLVFRDRINTLLWMIYNYNETPTIDNTVHKLIIKCFIGKT